jgi:glycogen operon protein
MLLAAMGLDVATTDDARARLGALAEATTRRLLPPYVVAHPGSTTAIALVLPRGSISRHPTLRIRSEDGIEQIVPFVVDGLPLRVETAVDGRRINRHVLTLPALAVGYHVATIDGVPDCECHVVVTPGRCHLPTMLAEGARRFGLAAHLYSLRRRGDQGIGDFTALAELGADTARHRGSVVAINPLHALFAGQRERASPYHPSDRRFLDPIYIDVEAVPDLAAAGEAQAIIARQRERIAALSAAVEVDYANVWQVKREVLEACFECFRRRTGDDPLVTEFGGFVAAGGEALRRFAQFEAIAAQRPRVPWQHWPAELRQPEASGVIAFARRHPDRISFACYLQWLAQRQLDAAAQHARAAGLEFGFLRDLAIGAAPDGAESWAGGTAIAQAVSVGAPPDPFSPSGQTWNLPPPVPHALAASGAAGFRQLLAANMRHAGALRIDHVMGLERLFWIPDGATPAQGTYVRYPFDLLLGVLTLESERARCLVIGEDLGTVPHGFRERLAAADVLSYRVLWFEREGGGFTAPAGYPARAAACVSTHDLPTIAGWWAGADIEERRTLGLLTEAQAAAAREERRGARHALAEACAHAGVDPDGSLSGDATRGQAITAAIHRYACASRAALVLLQADDLSGETTALNLPGTDRERPNWRRKLSVNLEDLWTSPLGRQAADDCGNARGAPEASDA